MRAWIVIALLLGPALSAGTVEGRALNEAVPLPGCTVTLSGGSITRTTVSGADGRYSLPAIPPGWYAITFELPGLETEKRDVRVGDEVTRVEDVEVRISRTPEVITLSCSTLKCSTIAPDDPSDFPLCSDHELNTGLIESAGRADRSAIDLLRERYKTTFTWSERHRIAGALLGKIDDDREYWDELSARAKLAIRFAYVDHEPSPEYLQWCETHRADPGDERARSIDALQTIATDARARGLLLEALESKDDMVVFTACNGIGTTLDESHLPKIEAALARFPEDAGSLAVWLVAFRSDAADQVAFKFLSEEMREGYLEARRQADCETTRLCEP